ncbi:S-layer homology domain-containing protein [Paenibacillus sp. LHD-117]|nr:S-layer homology domain-containing protein [Paenibacillus sp. LHD-117]MDQ6422241.1 S-layer homology domain-containing protein [Paenibacillus sp. LHD-117]
MKGDEVQPLDDHAKREALSGYQDAAQLSDWAKDAAAYLIHHGIVAGDGKGRLNSGETMTRAEAAALIYKLLRDNGWID